MSSETVNPKHVLGIDVLRFIAAMLVLVFHFVFLTTAADESYSAGASRYLVSFPGHTGWSHFGWVGVQIFFVISGFVIAYSGERATPFSFFSSRLVRLGPGTWICATITLAVVLGMDADLMANLRLHWHHYRNSVLFYPFGVWMDGTYWTLWVEISFYLVVFACIALGRFMLIRPVVIFIGLISSVYWLAQLLLGEHSQGLGAWLAQLPTSRLATLLLLNHGLFFALGVLLWLQLTKLPRLSNLLWGALFVAAGVVQIVCQTKQYNLSFHTANTPYAAVAVWLLALAVIVASVRHNSALHRLPQPVLRGLRTMGLMTFPLYLFHEVSGAAVMGWAAAAGSPVWGALAAGVGASLLASYVIAKFIEPVIQNITRACLARARAGLSSVALIVAK